MNSPGSERITSLFEFTIAGLQAALEGGELTSQELVQWSLARIAAYDQRGPGLNAMSCLNGDAFEAAAALDQERQARGSRGPLHGIPIVVKDNYETRRMQTAAGCVLMKGWMPPDDATAVTRLRDAGAIIIGKTNMHEWAYGYLNAGSLFGQTRSPYVLESPPGGSSGGSAVAVTANFAVAGLGTDTSGSVRHPAAMNNLVGLRSTPGLVSRAGIIPMSHTQDTAGPLARSVADLATVLDVLVGYDPADPLTVQGASHVPPSYTTLDRDALRGARIGKLMTLFSQEPFDPEVVQIVANASDEMGRLGAEIIEIEMADLPELARTPRVSLLIEELKADLEAYLAARPTAPVRTLEEIVASGKCIPQVTAALARSLVEPHPDPKAYQVKLVRRAELQRLLLSRMADHRLDALLYPTSRIKFPVIESTYPYNVALAPVSGLPALSVPAGFTADGMPVGMELLGRPWSEPRLLGLAYAFEQAIGYRRPPPTTPSLA